MAKPRILVTGLGSAGKRHWSNLVSLGCECSGMDPREDRRAEASLLRGARDCFTSVEEALAAGSYDGAVIASPPAFHISQLNALASAGIHRLLCEKPLTVSLADAGSLNVPPETKILLGYTYRWWPPLIRMRELLQSGAVGTVLHVRAVMSAHLADWHPWEDYQDWFMASKEQGGGALLDESHILDLIRWLIGMPDSLFARVETTGELEIDTDDQVDILMAGPGKTRVSIHLDLYARPHERQITVVGHRGTLRWSYERNAIVAAESADQDWDVTQFDCERNEMFLEVAREFLGLVDGSIELPSCTIGDGCEVLRLIEACRRSSDLGAAIELSGIKQ